ncbi:MAG: CDP-glycerol glycerophosphotransferase family protein [Actinomycetia bacterium]|nr:CDP-glycerol glycerophosphotransferase family protein [Actinomycetes bacterium]
MSRSDRVSRLARRLRRAGRAELRSVWRRRPLRSDTVLYESFSGNGVLCNPEAIFRYLLDHPDFQHLSHVWAVTNPSDPGIPAAYRSHPRVKFIKHKSTSYSRYLATAGFLVNNATFPQEFSKRPGQIYINTWHGTPLKKMGYSLPNGAAGARNIVRNFVAADYLLSSGPFMTQQMYAEDYRLRNIFNGVILEEGLPRTDRQTEPGARETARALLADAGLAVPDRLVVYAPTWRGESFYNPADSSADVASALAEIERGLPAGWGAVGKVHQVVHSAAATAGHLQHKLVPNSIPTNLLLAAADVLVTDYSSIFMDYLPLDRPIAFYLPDRANYEDSRGLYVNIDELPGPIAESAGELASVVGSIASGYGEQTSDEWHARRADWTARFAPHEDGEVTRRVVDAIFRGQRSDRAVDISSDGRERVLIYLGTLKPNGISTSALNLLANIDYERFDVSAFYLFSHKPDQARNIAAIEPHVRHLPWVGGMNGSKVAHARRDRLQRRGIDSEIPSQEFPLSQLFEDEWHRCFGDAKFDYILDFSGYGPLWDFILLQGKAKSHSVWLHNDMYADARREVHGEQHLFEKLHSVFTTYRMFDNLVSVSEELARVNSENLATYAPRDSFTFAHNTMDHEKVLRLVAAPSEPDPAAEGPPWRWRPSRENEQTFVTIGRLSTEKNHERLIRAFAQVHEENPNTRLIIIGTGPLADFLADLVSGLGLDDCVELAGFQANPYPALAGSDCFVLSSDHEGQPMVILEALTVGVPVVTTDFSSSSSALPDGNGLIVPRSVAGVADGMRAFLAGEVPYREFDPVRYNQQAMREFYRAIGAEQVPSD